MTKLGRVVALQVTLISIAVAAGIYITNTIIEDFLITEALENEAAHFWELYQENPDQPLPNTANMRGYLVEPKASGAGRRQGTDALAACSTRRNARTPDRIYGSGELWDESPTLFVSSRPTAVVQPCTLHLQAKTFPSWLSTSAFCRWQWPYCWFMAFRF